jgi:hypothetical protein
MNEEVVALLGKAEEMHGTSNLIIEWAEILTGGGRL